MIGTFSAATLILLALAVCGAVADWVVVAVDGKNRAKVRWLTKGLAPTLLILALALHVVERPKPSWAVTVATFALCLCLLGDYLLLDSKRFIPGMIAFGTAHLVLILAFFVDQDWDARADDRTLFSGRIIAVVVILVAASLPGRRILSAAVRRGHGFVVIIYMVAITAMTFIAGMHTPAPYGWFAFIGALLFYASDAVLGWRLFVKGAPAGHGDLAVMIPYHLALGFIGTWALLV
ncbi:MAG: lysoplasmalogenase family protein [Galactobacter sp.]